MAQLEESRYPVGSVERAKAQLVMLQIGKAMRTLKLGGHDARLLRREIDTCLGKLVERHAIGPILSVYFTEGEIGAYSTSQLLEMIYQAGDYTGFLKQAYQFSAFEAFPEAIEEAIAWHIERGRADAAAWERKFSRLKQNELFRKGTASEIPVTLDEGNNSQTFPLRPLTVKEYKGLDVAEESDSDPYIVSRVARIKMERANIRHKQTLAFLQANLERANIRVLESKLIDALAYIGHMPAIFEVKSLTASNERDQLRGAMAQLHEYQYRYRDTLRGASLWLLCSDKPTSQWYIDFLEQSQKIHVLWVEDGQLLGPSSSQLEQSIGGSSHHGPDAAGVTAN